MYIAESCFDVPVEVLISIVFSLLLPGQSEANIRAVFEKARAAKP